MNEKKIKINKNTEFFYFLVILTLKLVVILYYCINQHFLFLPTFATF